MIYDLLKYLKVDDEFADLSSDFRETMELGGYRGCADLCDSPLRKSENESAVQVHACSRSPSAVDKLARCEIGFTIL